MELVTRLFLLLLTPVGFGLFPVQTVAELDFAYANDETPLSDHHPGGHVSEMGESFRVSRTAQITNAEFLLFRLGGNPTVNLFAVVYLFDEQTKSPYKELAVSNPINATILPDGRNGEVKAAEVFKFEFEGGPLLSPGRTYAVALRAGSSGFIASPAYCCVMVGSAENIYPGIAFLYYQGSYHAIIDDFVFRVNGRVPGSI